jgi:hypothetical protein
MPCIDRERGEREREREREKSRMKHILNFPIMVSVQKLNSPSIITVSYIFWLNFLFFPVLY